jgi:hypothetical protein
MSISCRRYEILLPRRFNDGQPIPVRWLTEAVIELRERFSAASCETQIIRGEWEEEGEIYRDELVRVFVDVEDTPANREFFVQFRDRLKTKFRQLAIWLTSHPIDVL